MNKQRICNKRTEKKERNMRIVEKSMSVKVGRIRGGGSHHLNCKNSSGTRPGAEGKRQEGEAGKHVGSGVRMLQKRGKTGTILPWGSSHLSEKLQVVRAVGYLRARILNFKRKGVSDEESDREKKKEGGELTQRLGSTRAIEYKNERNFVQPR